MPDQTEEEKRTHNITVRSEDKIIKIGVNIELTVTPQSAVFIAEALEGGKPITNLELMNFLEYTLSNNNDARKKLSTLLRSIAKDLSKSI